jgi:O-antigen ligase
MDISRRDTRMSVALSVALWALCWGGMFTGIYNIDNLHSSNPFVFFQGIRAFFPLLAMYVSIIWILKERRTFPFLGHPVGWLFLYCLIGVASSLFLSPAVREGAYWSAAYLSPLLVLWALVGEAGAGELVRAVISLNYGVFLFLTFALLPAAIRIFRGTAAFSAFYTLPFGFGDVTKNGVARYALIVIIVAASRFLGGTGRRRFLWLGALAPALFLLMQTRSRTGLLGLVVISFLYVFLRGIDFRYFLAVPVVAFIVYTAGFQLRAQGRFDALLDLSGRGGTWAMALGEIGRSPFLGWGFNADRLLLNKEQMHNSYLHALIQTGVVGALCFFTALASLWLIVFRSGLCRSFRRRGGADRGFVLESILIMAFLTSRSFFESTAAFFGVDLLLVLPAMAAIALAAYEPASEGVPSMAGEGMEAA